MPSLNFYRAENEICIWIVKTVATLMLIISFIAAVFTFNDLLVAKEHMYCIQMDGGQILPKGNQNPPRYSGDPKGIASASLIIDTYKNRVILDLIFSDLDLLTAITLHGPLSVVNGTHAPTAYPVDGSVIIDPKSNYTGTNSIYYVNSISDSQAESIIRRPNLYYIQIDTEKYPSGSVRGSLISC